MYHSKRQQASGDELQQSNKYRRNPVSPACISSQLGLQDKASTRLKTTCTSTPAFVTTRGVKDLFMSATHRK